MGEIATYLGPKRYSIKKEYLSIEEQELIRRELMLKPFVPKSSMAKPTPFPVYRESKKKFYVPRFYGINTYGKPDATTITDGETIDLSFCGDLRPFQKPIVAKFVNCAKSSGAGLLEIHCGGGKTVMALNIISILGKKTLIIVHKEFLLRQWEERIAQFLPGARVGRIQGEIICMDDKDIVIGMLQSLSMKEYPASIFESFGLTIIDECHHLGAEVFSRALFKIVTPYMLGLSATMKRKDGLTKLFKMFIGDVVYRKQREMKDVVLVKGIKYQTNDAEFSEVVYNYRGQTHYAVMIKKLCEFNRRSEFILKVLADLLVKDPEQQVIILAHNKSLLKYLHDAVQHRQFASVGYYVGGMKEKDLKISEGKKVIIATYAMASEGLDIKTLTTLIMATPKSDVEQSVGRILRKKNANALVVDIIDQHAIFQRQWIKRRRWYSKQKFKIIMTDNRNYDEDKWEIVSKKHYAPPPDATSEILQGVCLIDIT